MKISNVEAFILESPYENRPPQGCDEAHGVKHCLLLKVSTDDGLVGWSDIETAPHVAAAVVSAPESGAGVFEGLRALVVGEDPFDVERLRSEERRVGKECRCGWGRCSERCS